MGRVTERGGSRVLDDGLYANIEKSDPDILLLTETKLFSRERRPEDFRNIQKWWGEYLDQENIFMSCTDRPNKSKGTAILIKPGLSFSLHSVRNSPHGRHTIVAIEMRARRYIIVCFYGYDQGSDAVCSIHSQYCC